jgi:hypothetical protein
MKSWRTRHYSNPKPESVNLLGETHMEKMCTSFENTFYSCRTSETLKPTEIILRFVSPGEYYYRILK